MNCRECEYYKKTYFFSENKAVVSHICCKLYDNVEKIHNRNENDAVRKLNRYCNKDILEKMNMYKEMKRSKKWN